jgi:molybdopterin-guanine dinucleotide biosynthesis protein A
MGVDKAMLDWNGRTALDRVAGLARALGAARVVAIGRSVETLPSVLDGGQGPVGGVIAAVEHLRGLGCERALVLAVDAPTLTPDDIAPLLAAPTGAAYEGQPFPMVLPVSALPPDVRPEWPMARLAARAGLARPRLPNDAAARLRGANTPEERQALLADLARREGAPCAGAD